MNRAASFLWAASVALVLSGPVFAENKVIDFKRPVPHTNVIDADSTNFKVSSTQTVDEQIIANRKGSNVAKFRPRGNAPLPRAAVKQRLKTALKTNAIQIAATVAIYGAVTAVGWVMSDGAFIKRKDEAEGLTYFDISVPDTFTCAFAQSVGPGIYRSLNYWHIVSKGYTFPSGYSFYNNCDLYSPPIYVARRAASPGYDPRTTTETPLTEADLDSFVSSIDTMSASSATPYIQELCAIDPLLCILRPTSFTNPDGTLNQRIMSPVTSTSIARLNPDGSISRLTRNQWSDFFLNYSPTGPDVNYKVENKSELKDDAGNTVEEETEKEEGTEPEPVALPDALANATDPLKDWATDIGNTPSATKPGLKYPLLFTYGGTCSIPSIQIPYLGNYSLDSICSAINDYVKPILSVLFAAWTALYIFGVWRETTMNVRPA